MCLWLHVSAVTQLPALTVTITYALIQMVKKIAGKSDKARMITKARVTELIMSGGACLMNVWISARRNGDEDEDVFVFLLTGATSLYGGEIIGILTVLFPFLGYGGGGVRGGRGEGEGELTQRLQTRQGAAFLAPPATLEAGSRVRVSGCVWSKRNESECLDMCICNRQ